MRGSHLTIDGDVSVQSIGFEGAAPPPHYAPPQQQGYYGAPQQPGAYGGGQQEEPSSDDELARPQTPSRPKHPTSKPSKEDSPFTNTTTCLPLHRVFRHKKSTADPDRDIIEVPCSVFGYPLPTEAIQPECPDPECPERKLQREEIPPDSREPIIYPPDNRAPPNIVPQNYPPQQNFPHQNFVPPSNFSPQPNSTPYPYKPFSKFAPHPYARPSSCLPHCCDNRCGFQNRGTQFTMIRNNACSFLPVFMPFSAIPAHRPVQVDPVTNCYYLCCYDCFSLVSFYYNFCLSALGSCFVCCSWRII
ncbi:early nodulin-75 isoform X3 [Plutella xylostella]|uniref:early nodulin-75 isoform X3 n=1 Tax=Plutella xylostella TaxID=51655 RepID=UPI002032B4FE|nr:early nodulin-75 isoform X3 [Plutella xylostella]